MVSIRSGLGGLAALLIWHTFSALAFAATEPVTIVVFDAELVDTSAEGEIYGENPAQTQRLAMITSQLREGLQNSGQYTVVDLAPAADELAEMRSSVRYLYECNDCELEIARALGTGQSAVVWVQKVSNLILNLNMVIKDAETGAVVKTAFVDIRGNTDRSWEHGANYMLKRRLLVSAED